MKTNMASGWARLSLLSILTASLLGCSSAEKKEGEATTSQTQTTTAATETKETEPAKEATAKTSNEVEMGDYHFQLSPDIQKNGEAHLDFYCHDKQDKHVVGLTGTFHITMPDGQKEQLPIEEEKPHDHYHGKLMLSQYGEYRVAAQVTVNGEKFNPRFTFERKQSQ